MPDNLGVRCSTGSRFARPLAAAAAALLLAATACSSTLEGPKDLADGGRVDGASSVDGASTGQDGQLPGADGSGAADSGAGADTGIDPTKDSDGDGLPDAFEVLFSAFDPNKADSDGDGVKDGDEDDDGDNLTAAQEWLVHQATARRSGTPPSPMHKDLLIEVDYQVNAQPAAAVLDAAIAALAAADVQNPDGKKGISAHIFVDEKNLSAQPMQEALSSRLDYLGAHGVMNSHGAIDAEMIHVIFVNERPGSPNRGGDTVASSQSSPAKAGSLIYVGNLNKIFPTCTNPDPPQVSVQEAITSTFIHEIGHLLQLGHDTTAGGSVNSYNIMSTDLGDCGALKQRTRGVGNTDPSLGATTSAAPRFSSAAAKLIKLTNKISVEANKFEVSGGYEM